MRPLSACLLFPANNRLTQTQTHMYPLLLDPRHRREGKMTASIPWEIQDKQDCSLQCSLKSKLNKQAKYTVGIAVLGLSWPQGVFLTLAVSSRKCSRLLECKKYFYHDVLPQYVPGQARPISRSWNFPLGWSLSELRHSSTGTLTAHEVSCPLHHRLWKTAFWVPTPAVQPEAAAAVPSFPRDGLPLTALRLLALSACHCDWSLEL